MGRLSNLAAKAARKAAQAAEKRAVRTVEQRAPSLVVPRARPALPAPPKVLALPAPGPGLPPLASKPRGGQWWVDKELEYGNTSPEEAARQGALALALTRWVPEDVPLPPGDPAARLRQAFRGNMVPQTTETDAQKWLERALTKYYKNDFGAPDDPLRDLAARGLHYEPDMTPEKWKATVDSYLGEDKIGDITVPSMLFNKDAYPGAGDAFTTEARMAMPWLAKAPVTDKLYGIQSGGLDLSHFTDEFMNALNDPEASGLPMDLAVRPESLDRMTFAQAAERVGRINQFRAKEMERAALDAQNNPVTHVFKEYADDNPMGLRWVEMAPPKGDGPTNYDVEEELSKALKYEGDTMGHCVGGYCPDVMAGRSRIFSLRDAKGEPHVTVETAPYDEFEAFSAAADNDPLLADTWNEYYYSNNPKTGTFADFLAKDRPETFEKYKHLVGGADSIIQIKGKQNRAPKDDYLPFVQDFVKSQQWSNVGDLGNAGLVRLPDGRYITQQQWSEGLNSVESPWRNPGQYDERYLDNLSKAEWDYMAPYFEGYAIGGRVDADRCFCHNPLSVKKKVNANGSGI